MTVNEAAQVESEPATIANLKYGKHGLAFDLQMPPRAYTALNLRLEGRNFIAEAELTGSDGQGSATGVPLGTYSLFDLTSRGLARNTTISLQESSFRYLHVQLRGEGFRLLSVEVPPSREGQTLFTSVAETRDFTRYGTETVTFFHVAARVPIERASVELDPGFVGNFSRGIRVTARAEKPGSVAEQVTGTILRVHQGAIHMEQESLPASLGANLQSDAMVEVAIENDGKPPLPLASVALAMRQRTICFDASGPVDLFYGDPLLGPPEAHYQPGGRLSEARLGPERVNPSFQARDEPRGWVEGHRRLVWMSVLAFLTMCCVLAGKRARKRVWRAS